MQRALKNGTLKRAEKILNENLPRWRRRKGFAGASIGFELDRSNRTAAGVSCGEPTGRIAIRIYVAEVVTKDDLHPRQKYGTIKGIPIQVEAGTFQQARNLTRQQPLKGGSAIIPERIISSGDYGTLGMPVRTSGKIQDGDSGVRYLTNAHVVLGGLRKRQLRGNVNKSNRMMSQPPGSTAPDRVIGESQYRSIILDSAIDVALIAPTGSTRTSVDEFIDPTLQFPGKMRAYTASDVGASVVKLGARSDLREGVIFSVLGAPLLTVGSRIIGFRKQLMITSPGGDPFVEPGDSGSIVLLKDDPNTAIGLVHGLSANGLAVACQLTVAAGAAGFKLA